MNTNTSNSPSKTVLQEPNHYVLHAPNSYHIGKWLASMKLQGPSMTRGRAIKRPTRRRVRHRAHHYPADPVLRAAYTTKVRFSAQQNTYTCTTTYDGVLHVYSVTTPLTFGDAEMCLPEAARPFSASLNRRSKCASYSTGAALAASFRDAPNLRTMS